MIAESTTVGYHVTRRTSLASVMRLGLHPRIGPRSAACDERQAAVFLLRSLSDVEDALSGWLGDAFDDGDALVLLRVELDARDRLAPGAGFEIVCWDAIPPSRISLVGPV